MKQPIRTRHAQKRIQQRGINDFMVRLVLEFGKFQYQKGGSSVVEIGKKDIAKLRRAVDKVQDVRVVLGDEDQVISVLHGYEKIRATQYSV
jgi:hypothetical protein